MTACHLCQRPLAEKRLDTVPKDDGDVCLAALVGGEERIECLVLTLARLVAKEKQP